MWMAKILSGKGLVLTNQIKMRLNFLNIGFSTLLQSKDLNLADFIPCYVSSHEKFLSMKHLMFDFTK